MFPSAETIRESFPEEVGRELGCDNLRNIFFSIVVVEVIHLYTVARTRRTILRTRGFNVCIFYLNKAGRKPIRNKFELSRLSSYGFLLWCDFHFDLCRGVVLLEVCS